VQHASRCGSWRLGGKVEGKRDEAAALWMCSGRRDETRGQEVGWWGAPWRCETEVGKD
jgi:hypothetical protein